MQHRLDFRLAVAAVIGLSLAGPVGDAYAGSCSSTWTNQL